MSPFSSSHSHDQVKLGDDYHQLQHLNEEKQASSSSTIPSHVLSYSNIQDQRSYYPRVAHQLEMQQEANSFSSEGESSNGQVLELCLWKKGNQISSRHYQNIPSEGLPSKLRLIRRMMVSDGAATYKTPANPQSRFEEFHKQGAIQMETTEKNSSSLSSTPFRVCSDCNTTKTPLWRSGPRGPKSLCNACGIRQRKARCALAAAAVSTSSTIVLADGTTPSKPNLQQKRKSLKIKSQISPRNKRSKLGKNNGRKKKLCFEDFLISLSKSLAFHQVFPQDEKEAAILLMALSSGLVHG